MNHRGNNQLSCDSRTFTLVEMLIVVMIMGVLALTMSYVLVSSRKVWNRGGALLELQTDLHLGFKRIAKQLREANWVTALEDGTQLVFYTPDQSGLVQRSEEGTLVILRGDYEADDMENVFPGDDLANVLDLRFALRAGEVSVSLSLAKEGERVSGSTVIQTRNLDMVGRWGMNEGDDLTAFDGSSSANNAALYDTTWVEGRDGGSALLFSPSAPSYASVPDGDDDPDPVDLRQRVVLDAVVRLETGSQTAPTLLSRGGWQPDSGFHWVYVDASTGKLCFEGTTGDTIQTLTSEALSWETDQWYRVVVSVDNVLGVASFWRDDEHQGTRTFGTAYNWEGEEGDLYLGVRSDAPAANDVRAWVGAFDRIAVGRN